MIQSFNKYATVMLGIDPTTPVTAISGVVSYSDVKQSQKSQEIQLVGDTDTLQYVIGGYYFSEKVRDIRKSFLSIIYTDSDLKNAVGVNPFTFGNPTGGFFDQKTKSRSYAAFTQVTWSPEFADSRLHITGGLRYTDDRKTFLRTEASGQPVNIIPAPFSEKRFDPAFTIAYDFSDTINAYARFARAYRSGGVSVRSPTFSPFGSEVNTSYEVGIKSDLIDRHLRANLAIFENRIKDRQVTSQIDPVLNPSITDTINAPGVTRIRGAELELTMVPTDGLQISASYGFLAGRPAASFRTIDLLARLNLPALPKHTVSTAVDYALPKTSIGQFMIHFDYIMSSKTPGTGRVAYNAFAYELERDVANGRITLQDIPVGPASLKLALFGKNLFNTAYPVHVAPGANAVLSPPRTYGVELGVNF